MQELRDATAVETKALMGQQESNMAALIGRLQVRNHSTPLLRIARSVLMRGSS